jgi:putative ABC transport system permease protein
MIRNYIKIAIRNLFKNSFYSFINIFGLSIGITACLLIMLYVNNEMSYDKFHKDHGRLYRVTTKAMMSETEIMNLGVTSAPVAERFRNDIEEIESITRLYQLSKTVKYKDDVFQENKMLFADSTFFDVFSFGILQGDQKSMLKDPFSIVMTEETAIRYFGEPKVNSGMALEEQIKINDDMYQVTGILQNVPSNSHFTFDMLVSMSTNDDALNPIWLNMNYFTYLKLHEGVNPSDLEEKITDIIIANVIPQVIAYMNMPAENLQDRETVKSAFQFNLQPVTDIHLHSDLRGELGANSDISYIYIFSSIALFIIIIACINFMNLSTARGSKRATEVGIRKTLGSLKYQLIRQFMIESILFSIIAMIIALGLTEALKYPFSTITGVVLALNIFEQPWILGVILGLTVIVGMVAGSYPAFYLTRFKPVEVLKGSSKSGRKSSIFRSALVVTQFAISIGLIVCTTLVLKQMSFMNNKNLGFEKENVIVIENATQLGQKREAFKNELLKNSEVINVAYSQTIPSALFYSTMCTPEGEDGLDVQIFINSLDYDFIDTYKMELVNGRNFSRDFPSDSTAILINESAAKRFGWIGEENDPIGRYISMINPDMGTRSTYYVVGVVKDFNYESCKSPISANVMFLSKVDNYVSIRVKPGDFKELIHDFESTWKKIAPEVPFQYSFLKQNFEELYQSEQKMSQIFSVFTTIAILIACLGLLGLAAFTAEQRTKEIGIRKTMGASVINVVTMLNLEFIKLVGIAIVIASPIAWYLMSRWLGDFIYKTEIGIWPFLLASFLAILIALITVGFQSLKAAVANPVNSLRSE